MDFLNTHFKLSFAFFPFSSHFTMKKEERREKSATERSSSVFLKKTLEKSTRYVVLIYYMQFSFEIFALILP